jgi:uncharacterized protein YoxC
MAKARKMVSLNIEETSGVDHPAHLTEGWLVIKSKDTDVSDLLSDLVKNQTIDGTEEEPMPQDENTIETPAEEVVVADETPATDAPAEEVEKGAMSDALAKIKMLEEEIAGYKKEMDKIKGKMKKDADDVVESNEEVLKAAPEAVQKMFADVRKAADEATARAVAAEEVLLKERDARADAEAIEKAKSWSHLPLDAEKIGPALRKLAGIDSDLAKSVEDLLTAVEAQAESANIFAEIGKSASPVGGNAYEQLTALAKSAVETSGGTFESAFADVVSKNTDLYSQYLNEKGVK